MTGRRWALPEYIGRYRAEHVVGSGAFATVWLAHDETLQAPVAIKVLAENWAHDQEVRKRFLEEARILWRANSDHLVRIHNVDELPDGRPYFVMDFADRGTLQERMAGRVENDRSWSFDEAVELSLEIADGLKVAHALGIVHRDLKPANIMFQSVPAHHGESRDEKLILTDFGMAKSVARSRGTTIATGTPYYMAPEQTEGRADERSDVYAAGVVLYELLAGRVPYPFDTPGRLFAAQAAGPPVPIGDLRSEVPPALAEVVQRAIATDPEARWQSAEAWAAALEDARAGRRPETLIAGVPGDIARTMAPEEIAAARAEPTPPAGAPAEPPPPSGRAEASGPGAPDETPPPAPPPAGTRRRRRRALTIGLPVAGVVAAVAAVAIVLVATGTKNADAGTLTLTPAGSVGLDPFTPSVVPKTAADVTRIANVTLPSALQGSKLDGLVDKVLDGLNPKPGDVSSLKFPSLKLPPGGTSASAVQGSAYGLYGGTQILSVCDKQKMIRFLEANPDKAAAWAKVQGLVAGQVSAYVGALTDVVLQADTRVTNHGFRDGSANPIDEILQAGTAVLVDAFGVPRARCYCGNPLTPPRVTSSKATVKGTPWPGFVLEKTVIVRPPAKPLKALPTSDVLTGNTFVVRNVGRPPADSEIVEAGVTTPVETTTPTPTTPATTEPATTTQTTSTVPPPATTTPPPATTAPAPQLKDITSQGTASASSTFSSQFPVSSGVDGDVTTSWFSIGDKEGPNSSFTWASTGGAKYIAGVQIVSNAANSDPANRTGFGFASVRVDVLRNGTVVWSGTGTSPGERDVTVYPKVEGDTVRLTLLDHDDPRCGGFAELRIIGSESAPAPPPASTTTAPASTTTASGDGDRAIAAVKSVLDSHTGACELTYSSVIAAASGGGYRVTVAVSTFGNPGTATWNVVGANVAPADQLAAEIENGCP